MLIRPTRAGAQVPATAHGLLATVASVILGISAHSLGGGHLPTALQLATVTALATCVGLVRAAQLRAVERSRARGRIRISATGTLTALAVGQAGAHTVLTLLDGTMHGGEMLPGPTMLLWHLLAIPAAAAVLFAVERLHRACGLRVARLWRLLSAPVCTDDVPSAPVDDTLTFLRPSPMVAAAGLRGPPSQV
ncbi:hypothetical protein [Gordonia phthalatica]|uniref:Uncharacterized protein n=1 Tax=Gordonia phthalatica TaxID=1136941 RepID=A0A0N9NEE6_9ACTN|nr:hypothetical protein [Gordonia phthalatica]ALG83947.1 hypothetical protein ACH46_04760 [Gordonia phthalatica]